MTFTFTVDCFPAFTKFNRKKKVQAVLQVIDQTDITHNYLDKSIVGHGAPDGADPQRHKDSEYNTWYTKSVFNQDEATTTSTETTDQGE